METLDHADGVHGMVPREKISKGARKLRDTYAITPGAPFFQKEFGYFSLERWKQEGMPTDVDLDIIFKFDPPGNYSLWGLGWCEAAFAPKFEEKVILYRAVQPFRGRTVLIEVAEGKAVTDEPVVRAGFTNLVKGTQRFGMFFETKRKDIP